MQKKVLITGVAKGIGRAIADKFLQEGYTLFGTFFQDKEIAYELCTQYGNDRVQLFGPYNFCVLDDIHKLMNELQMHTFDSIIFSAGIFSDNNDFINFDLHEFNRTMNCNFYAPLILATGLQNNIKKGGSIVIISSNDAYFGAYASMSYSISKSAVISLMKCLSVNYGLKNVRVNSVSPGSIDTDMNTIENMVIAPYFTPLSRTGSSFDVAKVVYFLASDEANFISGENVTIDGGYSIMSTLLKSEADPALSNCLQSFVQCVKMKKEDCGQIYDVQ